MPQSFDQISGGLFESGGVADNDNFIGYSARNQRTRAYGAIGVAEYVKRRIAPSAISINTTTNVITMTLADGTVITGTVEA